MQVLAIHNELRINYYTGKLYLMSHMVIIHGGKFKFINHDIELKIPKVRISYMKKIL